MAHAGKVPPLRAALDEARTRARGHRGAAACAVICDALDEIVRTLYHTVAGEAPGVALVATGTWGRHDACPYSDVDLLVLTPAAPDDAARAFAEKLLYPLWDVGLEVGHAVRSVPEALALAGSDLATATSLLDARPLAGDGKLAGELARALPGVLARRGDANDFVNRLIAEKKSRHAKFGDTLFLLEPNLKHGQGALRDLATGLWAARARWRVRDFAELLPLGQATARQVATLTAARDFLLGVRCALHLAARRRQDQLTFELQEAIAPELYPDVRAPTGEVRAAVAPAVEELMRRYYLHARGVVAETDRLLERALVPPQRPPKLLKIDPSFTSFNGQLSVSDPQIFRDRPSEMLRLFVVALERGLPVYGHTKELVAERVSTDATRLAKDPDAHRWFLSLLVDARDQRNPSLLEEMHELGLLSAVMPEFAPCTGRVQHDLYHVYTVDQHQLYAVALLKRLARGELAREVAEAFGGLTALAPVFLGTLLHDVGKPLGKGHSEKGARLAVTIARRLGLGPDAAQRVEFLVRHHLLMSHLSQRRDLDDVTLIEKFARVVKDDDTLRELYLLTYCDTAMTAPGNLTDWKAQLLRALYERTRAYLRRGPDLAGADRSQRVLRRRRRVAEMLGEPPEEVGEWLDGMPDRYVAVLTPRAILGHLRLARRLLDDETRPVAFAVHVARKLGVSEVLLVAADRPGLLARVAGVFLASRIDFVGAQIFSRPGLALDVFLVRDRAGRPIPASDPRWQRVEDDLSRVLRGEEPVAALIERRRERGGLARRVTPHVPTEIELDNEVSDEFTVIDVFTHDRPGVLYAITHTLTELGLDISFSRVATEAERVADVFYVDRVEDPAEQQRIAARLRAALAALDT
jgi:[protein-PII] uridylyltransferase